MSESNGIVAVQPTAPKPQTRRYVYTAGRIEELAVDPLAALSRLPIHPLTADEQDERGEAMKANRHRRDLISQAVAEAEAIVMAANAHPELVALRERVAKLETAARDADAEHTKSLAEFDALSASVADAMANGEDYAAIEKKRDKLAGEAVRIATRAGDLRQALARVKVDLSRREAAIVRDVARAAYPEADAARDKAFNEQTEIEKRHKAELSAALAVLAAADARRNILKRAAGDDVSVIVTRGVTPESKQSLPHYH